MHGPWVLNAHPWDQETRKYLTGRGVSLGTARIDWWILFNTLKEDEVNQPKDKIKRSVSGSRKQKSVSKMQREKKQDKKKRREAAQREAIHDL